MDGDVSKSDTEIDDAAVNGTNQIDGENEPFDYTKTDEYGVLLTELNQNLLCAIKIQLKNASALVRKATVSLLEYAATTNLGIDQLLLSYVCSECVLIYLHFPRGFVICFISMFCRTFGNCILISRRWCDANWFCRWTKY